jgi:hypothetical protein
VAVVEDVRWLGSSLERSYEVYVRGRLEFRVKQTRSRPVFFGTTINGGPLEVWAAACGVDYGMGMGLPAPSVMRFFRLWLM